MLSVLQLSRLLAVVYRDNAAVLNKIAHLVVVMLIKVLRDTLVLDVVAAVMLNGLLIVVV